MSDKVQYMATRHAVWRTIKGASLTYMDSDKSKEPVGDESSLRILRGLQAAADK